MKSSRFLAIIWAPCALLLIAASDPATETHHVVQQGETLKGIANRAGVALIVIAEANGIPEPYAIRSGQKLVIPRQQSHVVQSGETASGLAESYGVPYSLLALANNLPDNGAIRTGQRLIIPALLPERALSGAPRKPHFQRPHDGKIVLDWQKRPDGGGHDGLDFAARPGDMIRAASSGTVTFAGEEPKRFGRLVIIDHGNGWQSAYGHLSRITVKKGDPITTGERLGLAGQAGDADRPELHFEIRYDGEAVDPAPFLGLKG